VARLVEGLGRRTVQDGHVVVLLQTHGLVHHSIQQTETGRSSPVGFEQRIEEKCRVLMLRIMYMYIHELHVSEFFEKIINVHIVMYIHTQHKESNYHGICTSVVAYLHVSRNIGNTNICSTNASNNL
jgi:hypothetical protein